LAEFTEQAAMGTLAADHGLRQIPSSEPVAWYLSK